MSFVQFYREWKGLALIEKDEKKRIHREYERVKKFCHPRWTSDITSVSKKLDAVKDLPSKSFRLKVFTRSLYNIINQGFLGVGQIRPPDGYKIFLLLLIR